MSKKVNENKKNDSNKTFYNKMIHSVDRFNGTTLFFIVVLTAIVVFISCILLFSNKKYIYIPDYEKMSYSEDINPGVIVISSYNEVENDDETEIVKSNRIILSLAYVEKERNFKISDIRCNYIGVIDNDEYEYLTEHTNEDDMPNASARTHQFASTKSGSKFDYKSILGELNYVSKKDDGSEENKTIEYKTEMIELNEKDMEVLNLSEQNEFDNFKENSGVFSSYTIYQEVSDSNDSKTKKMYSTITIKAAALEKYVFDYQMFGVDENGNIDPMVGYYNLSTKVKTTYSRSTSVPFDKVYKFLIAKGTIKYVENGEEKELVLYSKKVLK